MELRHLETLIAIDEEGTFTAAADMLRTVQSNVSEQIRQLEAELGVTLLARGRSGATPTESGRVVLTHARRIRREVQLLQEDVAALQGLQVGNASFGIVGTASRWLVPALVADLRKRAPGIELRVNEGASERLLAEVLDQELAQAVVTEPVRDERLAVEHLLDEALVGLAPPGTELPPEPVPFEALAEMPLVLPPAGNPLRIEIEHVARARGRHAAGAGRGRGHPAHRRPRRRGRRRVGAARDRDPARAHVGGDLLDRRSAAAPARARSRRRRRRCRSRTRPCARPSCRSSPTRETRRPRSSRPSD